MAGTYADVPGRRMAWDADGSVGLSHRTESGGFPVRDIDAADTDQLNGEAFTTNVDFADFNQHDGWVAVMFPELRDLDGYYLQGTWGTSDRTHAVRTSTDTTNGLDGTFTEISSDYPDPADNSTNYRAAIASASATGIRCVRFEFGSLEGFGGQLRTLHLYGTISTGGTPDRLLFIDNSTGLEFTGSQDYGDIPRGSARDVDIKVKNNSGSLQANTITLDSEDLDGGSGSWYTFDSGSGFSGSLAVGNLAAGASSSVITVRQVIPDAATVGLHAARLYLAVASWT